MPAGILACCRNTFQIWRDERVVKMKLKTTSTIMHKKLAKEKKTIFKDAGGNAGGVVIDLETGLYYSFNNAGKEIWTSIDGKKNGFKIAKNIAERYKVRRMIVEKDVKKFIAGLKRAGLIYF